MSAISVTEITEHRLQESGKLLSRIRSKMQVARSPGVCSGVNGQLFVATTQVRFDGATGHLERDDLEHPNARNGHHGGRQVGTESGDLLVGE